MATNEVIGCPMEYMTVIESDTDIRTIRSGSYASSTTYVTGTAAKMAAEELRTKIITKFAQFFETDVENIDFDGVVATTKDGSQNNGYPSIGTKIIS